MDEMQRLEDKYCGASCTLNGGPAFIAGRHQGYASICLLSDPTTFAKYTWTAVDYFMQHMDKAFV